MNQVHHLDNELLVDPYWSRLIINPCMFNNLCFYTITNDKIARAALICSDNWATVSPSYLIECFVMLHVLHFIIYLTYM